MQRTTIREIYARAAALGGANGRPVRLGPHPARFEGVRLYRAERRQLLQKLPGRLRARYARQLRRDRPPKRGRQPCGGGHPRAHPRQNRQPFEVKATRRVRDGRLLAPTTRCKKKRHSMEFLREIAYLRPRTNTFGAVFRIRSEAAFAIHKFFNDRGFVYVHTPIITGSDCEGAGRDVPGDDARPRQDQGRGGL